MIRVFIDTSIARAAETIRVQSIEEKAIIQWGDREFEVDRQVGRISNPQEKLLGPEHGKLLEDMKAIPKIESLARRNLLSLYWDFETKQEYSWKKNHYHKPQSTISEIIQEANSPILYRRVVASAFSSEDHQFEYLKKLSHKGFDRWKSVLGVVQNSKREKNQLMDAWHLWTAEQNNCDYFLSVDYKLLASVEARPVDSSLQTLNPSKFLSEIRWFKPSMYFERFARSMATRKRKPEE